MRTKTGLKDGGRTDLDSLVAGISGRIRTLVAFIEPRRAIWHAAQYVPVPGALLCEPARIARV
jgi:hypothetical protein